MLLYFKIAEKYNIIDKSNIHKSYNYTVIKGGGIVFWLAGALFSLTYLSENLFFLIGFTLICGISFWNDITALPVSIRLVAQLIAVGLIFFDLDIPFTQSWWIIPVACIICAGIINAYNFMDEINGMTGLNSLVVLGSLQYVNQNVISFTHSDFIIYAILACLVFLFFNARTNAKCTAGTIGSIGIAFWIVILLLKLILTTNDIIWILFLAIYGVDTICTILHRIYLKQNIIKPHQLHFYQTWVNKTKCPHLWVSVIYATAQLIICIVVIYLRNIIPLGILAFTLLGFLTALYSLKFQHDFDNADMMS